MNDIDALKERFYERKIDFLNSVNRLHEALEQPVTSFIRDSIIKRFETMWETGWKLLKLWLSYQGVIVSSPRDAWREAFALGLLTGDADIWGTAQRMRSLTVHTYDESIAEDVHKFIRHDAIILFQTLKHTAQTWHIPH